MAEKSTLVQKMLALSRETGKIVVDPEKVSQSQASKRKTLSLAGKLEKCGSELEKVAVMSEKQKVAANPEKNRR